MLIKSVMLLILLIFMCVLCFCVSLLLVFAALTDIIVISHLCHNVKWHKQELGYLCL